MMLWILHPRLDLIRGYPLQSRLKQFLLRILLKQNTAPDHLDHPDHPGNPDHLDLIDNLHHLVAPDHLDHLDHPDHPGNPDHLDFIDNLDRLVDLVSLTRKPDLLTTLTN